MLHTPLTLPCGHTLPNRICKSAMTEGLATPAGHATAQHVTLYDTWAQGGAAMLVTGNFMVDGRYLERAGNVVAQDASGLEALRIWANSVHANGSQLWAQISHPGRQCPRMVNLEPLAPSPVQLHLSGNFGKPRAATQEDIFDIIERFATTAALVQSAGMDGVQIHAAHGYLLSQFLSPSTNQRTDDWGGSLANRARLLLRVVQAVRQRVGPGFPIAVKINSADFVAGGFTLEECLQVVGWLNDAGVDLLEVSGGTYEQLAFFKQIKPSEVRDSTRQREAMFLQYAQAIKQVARMPIMVTGGFRTRAGMEDALQAGHTDMVGLARPFCTNPDFPKRMFKGEMDTLPIPEDKLVLGEGYWGPNSPSGTLRGWNNLAQVGWYYRQIERLAQGLPVPAPISPLQAMLSHLRNDTVRSIKRKLAG